MAGHVLEITLGFKAKMKDILSQLNPAFDHRNRLGIMALLVSNERLDYNTLRSSMALSDGNLASHLKPLEYQGYITVYKVFIARRPQTTYAATELGRAAFSSHLDALETMIDLGREV